MGWEQRGNNQYYYKKERQGSKVKSIYVGRGEIARMIAQLQSESPLLEKLARTIRSHEELKFEKAEAALAQATDLIMLITEATLLTAGYHTHKRQWRKRRKCQPQDRLRTFRAEATLVYYNARGKRINQPVPVEGVVLH